MSPETTLEMIYRWLLEGKKIRHKGWGKGEFLHMINGMTYDEYEKPITHDFDHPDEWELYQEPKEKVKWFQVIAHHKNDLCPFLKINLHKSEQDYLDFLGYKKEDFHWIKLIEVDYDT